MVQASGSALAARSVLNSMPNRFIAAFLVIVLWQVGSQGAPFMWARRGAGLPECAGTPPKARHCAPDDHGIHVVVDQLVLKGDRSPENGVIGRVSWWIGALGQAPPLSASHMRGAGCGARPERMGGLFRSPENGASRPCGAGAHWVRQGGAAGAAVHAHAPRRVRRSPCSTDSQPWAQENGFSTMTFHYGFLAFLWELTF